MSKHTKTTIFPEDTLYDNTSHDTSNGSASAACAEEGRYQTMFMESFLSAVILVESEQFQSEEHIYKHMSEQKQR